jgi:hypothetical protein
MSEESDMENIIVDGKKSIMKPSMVSINDLHSTPARKLTSSWCISTPTSSTSFQLPTVNMINLLSHQQPSTTTSCNNPDDSYIANYDNDPITVPSTTPESEIAIMTATPTLNQPYKIQTRKKCPMIVENSDFSNVCLFCRMRRPSVRFPTEEVVHRVTDDWIKNNMVFQRYDVLPFVKYIEPEPPPSNLYSLRMGRQ